MSNKTDLKPLISIFIPVYNGEKYLLKTLTSIQNQTYNNFEVILLDDSSTDASYTILKEFSQKDNRFKVFQKENGKIVPVAINYIMPYIKGDFYFYLSQDDFISEDLLEKMMNRQQETNADCVLPDMEFYFERNANNKKIIGLSGNRGVILSGKEALLASLSWNIHGFALFKTSLVTKEKFPEDAFDADEYMTRKFFYKSNKVVFCEGTFFYRQDNANAITKSFSFKNFYSLNSSYKLLQLLKDAKVEKRHILNMKIEIFFRLLNYQKEIHHFKNQNEVEFINTLQFLRQFKNNMLQNSKLKNATLHYCYYNAVKVYYKFKQLLKLKL